MGWGGKDRNRPGGWGRLGRTTALPDGDGQPAGVSTESPAPQQSLSRGDHSWAPRAQVDTELSAAAATVDRRLVTREDRHAVT